MAATPPSGQISFNDILNLAKDQLGYTPPANVGLQALTLHVRAYGQVIPINYPNNIAFSDFRNSTIVKWSVSSTPETYSQYGNNNNGTIAVALSLSSFKTGSSGLTLGKKGIQVSVPGATIQTIYTTDTGVQTVNFGGSGGIFNTGTYTVSVLDMVTNVTTTKNIAVG